MKREDRDEEDKPCSYYISQEQYKLLDDPKEGEGIMKAIWKLYLRFIDWLIQSNVEIDPIQGRLDLLDHT